ncbi:DDHD domain-containing protein [Aspergillus cavernicola]|uniref:DDHD domain-containing protein n=1 Tax=Aspergillus cavernicola TaxID=176166 RepID=A0ABR4IAA2_9EURO
MAKEAQTGTASLGTFPSWSNPGNTNSQPNVGQDAQETLQRSQGEDHTVSHRHLSLRHYPADCPPLKVKWFMAVDVAKWKPSHSDRKKENSKPVLPKKFVPFTSKDSQSIEHAFQELCNGELEREQAHHSRPTQKTHTGPVKVPVNEDYLFDVNINRRELAPAYWVGPIYEVRRGTWFFQEGSTIRPCEENLATQLEEGYLKVKPWRSVNLNEPSSQPLPTSTGREQGDTANISAATTNEARKHRLFGSYMNNIVTYQDSTTALLASDDFMSTVYQSLGGVPGTKLVRGFNETKRPNETQDKRSSDQKSASEPLPTASGTLATDAVTNKAQELAKGNISRGKPLENATASEIRPETTLERRVSSLADAQRSADLEEEARKQEEQEMEDSREADNEDRERDIDHLVLVTHGIGQRLGIRLESVNFIHDVSAMRRTMKSVYKASPDLQALNSTFPDKQKNCRVQVLPVCWRHLLQFPYKEVGQQARREHDLADADTIEDNVYPTLADITLESVPAVRNLISDLAVDVLLYQSKYCEHITSIVQQECNRIVELYKKRNPSFSGSVSLTGHSLGSAILFDILCSGDMGQGKPNQMSEKPAGGVDSFDFECEEFFCLGSPVALFQMLKGKTIAGRPSQRDENRKTPSSSMEDEDTFHAASRTKRQSATLGTGLAMDENQFAVSVPNCRQLYNIFHPSDPVSYRMEPLISPAMSSLKPQPLPSVKRSIWTASGQSLSLIGSRVGQSVGSLWTNFTSGVASNLLNRSLGISSDGSEESSSQQSSSDHFQQQRQSSVPPRTASLGDRSPTLIDPEIETLYEGFQRAKLRREKSAVDSKDETDTGVQGADRSLRKLQLEDEKVRLLNSNGRVDYSIQEGAFDISLIASLASHLSYWSDEDVNHFMLSQMLCRKSPRPRDR